MTGSGVIKCSAKFLAALTAAANGQESLQIATSAEIWSGSTLLVTLAIENSSTVTVDRANLIRRSCSGVLTDPFVGTPQALVPQTSASALTVYGNEVVLYRGITYSDGTQELIQLGVFGMNDIDVDDQATDLVITITGYDRGVACQHAGFADTYTIAPGTNIGTAIQTLIASLQTGIDFDFAFAPTAAVTPAAPVVYSISDDPWKAGCDLAASIGYELFFDPAGVCTFLPVPNPLTQVVSWTYAEGLGNLATHLKRRQSRTNAPNHIIRDGQGSGLPAPVRGESMDTNPLSPTFVGGQYGHQRDYASSSLYATQAQAQAAADADLLLSLGTVESINIQAVPKVDHDVDDVVSVTRVRSGLSAMEYVIDSFSLGFGTAGLIDFVGRQISGFPSP